MSIFRDFFVKEKPVFTGITRGIGGFGFGASAGGGGAGEPFSASGGTVTTPGNGYTYHTYSSTGPDTFVVNSGSNDIELLVVAGGGGAGDYRCSGAGAGGLIYYGPQPTTSTAGASFPVTTGTYNIQVGAGGPGGPSNTSTDGTPSYFGPVVATGGGAARLGPAGNPGGSGGGWGVDSAPQPYTTAGSGVPGQGFPGGGTGSVGGGGNTGGGGGAGERGGDGSGSTGGDGGDGLQFPAFTGPLIGLPALNPLNGYFAGGGAGAAGPSNFGFVGGTGGAGGGGTGNQAGVTNSGGGAASGYPQTATTPRAGGPGIVVVRYLT